jgi:hypothetical protein
MHLYIYKYIYLYFFFFFFFFAKLIIWLRKNKMKPITNKSTMMHSLLKYWCSRIPLVWQRRWTILRWGSVLAQSSRRRHPRQLSQGSGRTVWLEQTIRRQLKGWCALHSFLIVNKDKGEEGKKRLKIDGKWRTDSALLCEWYPENIYYVLYSLENCVVSAFAAGWACCTRSLYLYRIAGSVCQKLTHPLMICTCLWCHPCPIDRPCRRRRVSLSEAVCRFLYLKNERQSVY